MLQEHLAQLSQTGAYLLHVFVQDVFRGIANHVDNAQLNPGIKKYGANRFGKTGQSVHTGYQDLFHPMAVQIV
jgi:hypothetical protein